jgi:hypothetical protein
MRKFTYEVIKQVFEERGYELLDQEYVSTRVKMRFRCPIHPNDEQCTTFDNFLRGKTGCVCCSGKKHSIDEVRKEFEKRGYQLLETRYINSITKMRYRCPKHPDKINKIEFYAYLMEIGARIVITRQKANGIVRGEILIGTVALHL